MHIFEVTTQVVITPEQQLITPDPNNEKHNFPPVQIMLGLKQRNAKKINSHRYSLANSLTQMALYGIQPHSPTRDLRLVGRRHSTWSRQYS
jgi:hypothetical protein